MRTARPCAGCCRIQVLNRPHPHPTPARPAPHPALFPLDRKQGSAWRTPAPSSFQGSCAFSLVVGVGLRWGVGGGCPSFKHTRPPHTPQVSFFPLVSQRSLWQDSHRLRSKKQKCNKNTERVRPGQWGFATQSNAML